MATSQPTNTPAPALPVYMTQSALARRLGVCPLTVRRRLAAGVIQPDGALVSGMVGEISVFNMANLPQFRAAMRGIRAPAAPPIVA